MTECMMCGRQKRIGETWYLPELSEMAVDPEEAFSEDGELCPDCYKKLPAEEKMNWREQRTAKPATQ